MGSFLFFAFSWWSILLRVVAIVHFVRRRPDWFWIWVILFHWVGALVYIVVEVIPDAGLLRGSLQVFPRRKRIKELERAIVGRKFRHGGHPILRWHFSNIAVETDKAGNQSFHKGKSKDRIDGAVARAMAVGRAMQGESNRSSYDTFEGDIEEFAYA